MARWRRSYRAGCRMVLLACSTLQLDRNKTGSIIEFLRKYPAQDKLILISQIANGLDFLHCTCFDLLMSINLSDFAIAQNDPVVHGDVKAVRLVIRAGVL